MVEAHQEAQRGVEDEPGGEEGPQQGFGARERSAGEDERDGGEEEAWLGVGDEGEEGDGSVGGRRLVRVEKRGRGGGWGDVLAQ